jgi:hypothetical protein
MDVILKPATKIQNAMIIDDEKWNASQIKHNDKSKMRTLNSVLTRVVQIYNTYGFYVKPTKEVKENCPKLYQWLTSGDITKVECLNFRGNESACTNIPIVFSVISMMIEKQFLKRKTSWSAMLTKKGVLLMKSAKAGKKAFDKIRELENGDLYARPYKDLFPCHYDVALDGEALPEKTHLLKRNLEQLFNCLVYARQKPLFSIGGTLPAKKRESNVIDPRFFAAVNKTIEDMSWQDMVNNLSIEVKIRKKKAKNIHFDGFLNKQDVKTVNIGELKEAVERLEETERRFLEKAAHTRVNIEMLKHVDSVDSTIPYNQKFLTGGSNVPFPRVLVDPVVAELKKTIHKGISDRIDDSWEGLHDFQALWDRVTNNEFQCEMLDMDADETVLTKLRNSDPEQQNLLCKLICNFHIIIG